MSQQVSVLSFVPLLVIKMGHALAALPPGSGEADRQVDLGRAIVLRETKK